MNSLEDSKPRRYRFSLRTVLVLFFAAALGLSFWVSSRQWRKTQEFQAEIKRLRGELGELTIEEGQEDRLHAIIVPTLEATTWKWRVYVPNGATFYIKAAIGEIPETGEPKSQGVSSTFQPGERIVTLALRKDDRDKWEWVVQSGTSWMRTSVSQGTKKLIEEGYSTSTSTPGDQKVQQVVDRGVDLELLRLRMFPQAVPGVSQYFQGPAPGILLRISETPP